MISHMLWTDHFFSHMVSPGKKKNAQGKVLRFQNKAGFHTSRSITLLSNFTLYFVTGPSVTLCLYRAPQDDNFCIFWFCMSYLRLQRRLSGQWNQADAIIMSFSSKNYKHNNDCIEKNFDLNMERMKQINKLKPMREYLHFK